MNEFTVWVKKTRSSVIFFALALLISIGIVIWIPNSFQHIATSPEQKLLSDLLLCPSEERESTYSCMMPKIRSYGAVLNSKKFNSTVTQSMKETGVGPRCHIIMHSLGRVLYETSTTTQEALGNCTSICANGCAMGVLESFLVLDANSHISPKELIEKADSVCLQHAHGDKKLIEGCYHGVGHGLVRLYDHNDLQYVAGICDRLTGDQKPSCYAGASMEVILPIDITKTILVDSDSPDRICRQLKGQQLIDKCYFYLPEYWRNQGISREKRGQFCDVAISKKGCSQGIVHTEITRYFSADESYLLSYMSRLNSDERASLFGLIYSRFKDSKVPIQFFCDKLSGNAKTECNLYLLK